MKSIPSRPRRQLPNRILRSLTTALVAMAYYSGASQSAHAAATYTWNNTNLSGTGDWNTAGNWSPNTNFPGSLSTDVAGFGAGAGTSLNANVNLSSSLSIGQIAFLDANSFGYTITGNPGVALTLGAAGSATVISGANTSGTNTIAANLILTNGAKSFSVAGSGLVVSGNISETGGTASLSLSRSAGTAVYTLSGSNSFSGGVSFGSSSVTLNINNNNALGSGTLTLGNNSGGLGNTTGGTVTVTNALSLTSASGNGLSYTAASTGNLVFSTGPLTLSGAGSAANTQTITVNSNALTFGGIVGESGGAHSLAKAGVGTLVLSNSNTYSGTTSITAGILSVNNLANGLNASAIGQSSNAAANLVIAGGTLQYTGGTGSTDRNFTVGSGNGTIDASGSGALTIGGSAAFSASRTLFLTGTSTAVNTMSGTLANNGAFVLSITKNGAGTWALSGNNTYTGNTTVTLGKLLIANSAGSATGSGAVNINPNTGSATIVTLAGNGTISGGLVTLSATSASVGVAHLAPGVNTTGANGNFGTAATITLGGGLTIGAGANLDYDLSSSSSSGNDLISLGNTGVLTLPSSTGKITINYNLLGASLDTSAAYTLIAGATSIANFNTSNIITAGLNGYTAAYASTGTSIQVTFTSTGVTITPLIGITTAAHTRVLVNASASISGTYGNSGASNMTGASILDNAGTLTFTPGTPSNPFTVTAGSTGNAFSGTVATGSTAAVGRTYSVKLTDGTNTATASSTLDVVNARTFVSGTIVNLGNILLGSSAASINANSTITTSGTHAVTEDATLNAYAGGAINGLTLSGSSTVINGANATDNITRSITGTISGTSGALSGTFGLGSVNELSGTNSNAAQVRYTANVFEQASLTTGTSAGTGGSVNLQVTNAAAQYGQRAGVTVSGTSFVPGNSNFIVTGTNGGVVGDSGTSGGVSSTVGTVSVASNRLNGVYTYTGSVTASAAYTDPTLASQGTPSLPGWTVSVSGTVSSATSSGPGDIKSSFVASGGAYNNSGASSSGTANPLLTSGVGGGFGTKAYILSGSASANVTLQASFSGVPAGSEPDNAHRSSDILTLAGLAANSTGGTNHNGIGPDGSMLTDVYVLQLTYDPSSSGAQFIGWYDAAQGQWVNAVAGNSNAILPGAYFGSGEYIGSYASYLSTLSPGDQADIALQLGSFGYDPATHTSWAVLDHNSEFAVIPEPGTWAMVAVGACALIIFKRRKNTCC